MKVALWVVLATAALIPVAGHATDGGSASGSSAFLKRTAFHPDSDFEDPITPVHYRPVFLGCVYSYHQCEHRAHGRGFYNHFTRHDHGTCHHGPSYACYGQ